MAAMVEEDLKRKSENPIIQLVVEMHQKLVNGWGADMSLINLSPKDWDFKKIE